MAFFCHSRENGNPVFPIVLKPAAGIHIRPLVIEDYLVLGAWDLVI
jgi:hypothetical protein